MPEGQQIEIIHLFQSLAFFIIAAVRYQPCYQIVSCVKISGTVRDIGHYVTLFHYPFNQSVMVPSALPLQIQSRGNKYYLDSVNL